MRSTSSKLNLVIKIVISTAINKVSKVEKYSMHYCKFAPLGSRM